MGELIEITKNTGFYWMLFKLEISCKFNRQLPATVLLGE